jgi:Phage tail protein.
MRRIGQRFEFYVARIGHTSEEGYIHHDTFTQIFHDVNNEYQGRLRYVEIHIGKFGDTPSPTLPRINAIEVFEHKKVLDDETPYIIYPGDIIIFDHKNADIFINGESRMDLKQLGASFFKLKKGENRLVVSPDDSFDVKCKYRPTYL